MNSLRGCISSRQLSQHLAQRMSKLHSSSTSLSEAPEAAAAKKEIKIPLRKERTPTDILMALDKTISRDYTAAHYKYMDDPYLIPLSNRNKRSYALAKEAGRKAASWILNEHRTLFDYDMAEPKIKAFMPKGIFEKKEDVSEELLMNSINEGSVGEAVTIYKLLGPEISIECKQALLELLCFYNCTEQLPDDMLEEKAYRKVANRQIENWRSCPELEELFEFLSTQDKPIAAAAYNALICGTAKYLHVNRAWSLFEECEQKNIPLSLSTYNQLIQLISVVKDGVEERNALLIELLTKMNEAGLRPDIGTFNSALRVISKMHSGLHVARELLRSLYSEFRKLGIKPSLASYYFALITFCKERGPRSRVLRQILEEMKDQPLEIRDPADTLFFLTAMDVAKNHLNDYDIAEKVNELLLAGDNYKFIGEGFKEHIYYRHYSLVLLEHLSFKDFMSYYDTMVPSVYVPEPSVMEGILERIETTDSFTASEVLARLWSQMYLFEHLNHPNLVTRALNLMRTTHSPPKDSPAHGQFAEAAWTYWNFVQEQNANKLDRFTLTGEVVADIVILSLRGEIYDRFHDILEILLKDQNSFVGTANHEQMEIIFEALQAQGYAYAAINVVKYCEEAGFPEALSMAETVKKTMDLTPEEDIQIEALLQKQASEAGKVALKEAEQ